MNALYKRVILKLSGEALKGEAALSSNLYNKGFVETLCDEFISVVESGVQLGIVVGAGNIFRGDQHGINHDKAQDHFIGMTAIIVNGLILQEILRKKGAKAICLSAIEVATAETYSPDKAQEYLAQGYIVILAGGSGNPFCTTDFAATLRAIELKAEVVFKATKVDGVYDKDPKEHTDAQKYTTVSYSDALEHNLKVMDQTAFALAKEHKLPIQVFNIFVPNNFSRALASKEVGSLVSG